MQSFRKFFLAILWLGFTVSLQAQHNGLVSNNADWYVGVNGGANYLLAESSSIYTKAQPLDAVGYSVRFEVGYNFSQALGVRGMISENVHRWPDDRRLNSDRTFKLSGVTSQTFTIDATVNLLKLGQLPKQTLVDFIAFGGLGVAYLGQNKINSQFSPVFRVGLQGNYKLTLVLDLNLMGEMNIVGDNYNDYIGGKSFDAFPTLCVGVSYHLNRKKWI